MKRTILAALIAAMSLTGTASALGIDPVQAVYAPGQDRGILQLVNQRDRVQDIQITAYEVRVVDGKPTRVPSETLRFSPSVVSIAPNAKQVVRYRREGTLDGEVVYIVRVEELPPPATETKEMIKVDQLIAANLHWIWRGDGVQPSVTAKRNEKGVAIHNAGTATAQLVNLSAGPALNVPGLASYVYPGATLQLPVVKADKVHVQINGKPQVLDIE
ncbi:fimbrial biogenesis chaperone [Pseudoxanthomonas winnipegensis]|uniref:fimbrial biogenesis chaperone n=1 Tax=Pseudoxanthomonas winnipegensis TaxID=2480810 RepID=UPI00103D8B9F|nr:fimbria/pilus periplasmic chaperone [Pseudoxanthomonas winnipegensis]TBV69791.1 molecular chaperone [Pseudoxanthomonas winnipegensis]